MPLCILVTKTPAGLQIMNLAAAYFFSRKLNTCVSQTTVQSIWDAYKSEVKRKRRADCIDDVTILPEKKRGRSVLLGRELDSKVQLYLRKVREGGGVVSARIAMAAAKGIIMSCDR